MDELEIEILRDGKWKGEHHNSESYRTPHWIGEYLYFENECSINLDSRKNGHSNSQRVSLTNCQLGEDCRGVVGGEGWKCNRGRGRGRSNPWGVLTKFTHSSVLWIITREVETWYFFVSTNISLTIRNISLTPLYNEQWRIEKANHSYNSLQLLIHTYWHRRQAKQSSAL